MAGAWFHPVAQFLRRVRGPSSEPRTDAELLHRYLALHDHTAFEVLVWRTGRWFWAFASAHSAIGTTPRTLF
jgi:hypothetical protein